MPISPPAFPVPITSPIAYVFISEILTDVLTCPFPILYLFIYPTNPPTLSPASTLPVANEFSIFILIYRYT